MENAVTITYHFAGVAYGKDVSQAILDRYVFSPDFRLIFNTDITASQDICQVSVNGVIAPTPAPTLAPTPYTTGSPWQTVVTVVGDPKLGKEDVLALAHNYQSIFPDAFLAQVTVGLCSPMILGDQQILCFLFYIQSFCGVDDLKKRVQHGSFVSAAAL